jgi:hypothetical protein
MVRYFLYAIAIALLAIPAYFLPEIADLCGPYGAIIAACGFMLGATGVCMFLAHDLTREWNK